MDQPGILAQQSGKRRYIAVDNRIGGGLENGKLRILTLQIFYALHKLWPALKSVLACNHQLRVSKNKRLAAKFRFVEFAETRMVAPDTDHRFHVSVLIGLEKFFGLFPVLLKVGMCGEFSCIHTKLLSLHCLESA